MKIRSIKAKKPVFEYQTVTEIELQLTGKSFPPVSTEGTPEIERNKVK